MTHISATGNLARTPELREGTNGPYCYAAVIVNDRYRDAGGSWHDGEATRYDLTVTGNQAENLVRTAAESGNVRVQFSGDLTRQPWSEGDRSGVNNRVRVDDVGISLRGNIDVAVTKRAAARPAAGPQRRPHRVPHARRRCRRDPAGTGHHGRRTQRRRRRSAGSRAAALTSSSGRLTDPGGPPAPAHQRPQQTRKEPQS